VQNLSALRLIYYQCFQPGNLAECSTESAPIIECFGSRFDQARTFVARPTPEAKDARERTQICTASFPLKNDLLL
jgi:hypothetical protein